MSEPITLDQAKKHLGVTSGDWDELIEVHIAAAREHVERVTGLALTRRQVVEVTVVARSTIEVGAWPVAGIESIAYIDGAGASRPVDTGWYAVLQSRPVRIRATGAGWGAAAGQPVVVTMTAGYETADDVPATVRAAMLLLIGNLFENREAVVMSGATALPLGVDALLAPYRLPRV